MGVTAVLLAAGRGDRLRPHTDDRPKCLVELDGMSLLARQLETLHASGIFDVTIVTGYRGDMLAIPGTHQVHNPDWATTNMVETLFRAEDRFSDDMIVAYTDIVYEPRVLVALLRSPHDISVVVDRAWRPYWERRFEDPLCDAESLRLDEEGGITEIGAPVAEIEEIEAQYMGLLRFRGSGVEALRSAYAELGSVHRPWMTERPVCRAYMTDLLMEMILTGHRIHAVETKGGWLEIDTTEDYDKTHAMMADGSIMRFFDPGAVSGRHVKRRKLTFLTSHE